MLTVIVWYGFAFIYVVAWHFLKKGKIKSEVFSKSLTWSLVIFAISSLGMYLMFYLGIFLLFLILCSFIIDRIVFLVRKTNRPLFKGMSSMQFVPIWFLTLLFLIVHDAILLVVVNMIMPLKR